jgi:hypothetical protein
MILMSFVRDDFLPGYERGEELIRNVLQTDMTVEEALDELVHSELGEDTTSGKSVRTALRWVFRE